MRLLPFIAILLVLVGAARIVATYHVFNQTFDEPCHIACALQWMQHGKYQVSRDHTPLARMAMGIGPYLAGLRPTYQAQCFAEGNQVLYSGGHYFRNLALARLGILPFFILACALVWSWSKRLFGEKAALASTLLFTTLPPILAHSGLATTDMAVSTFIFASVYAFSRWLERPDWKRSVLFGLSAALAVLSKLSALLFLPACFLAILPLYWFAERKGSLRRIASLPLAAIVAFLAIWAGYWFSFGPMRVEPGRPSEKIDRLIGKASLPAPDLFEGVAEVEWHNSKGHSSWLLGESRDHGWWYFFLVVLFVKTPIAFLLLCGIGYDAYFARRFVWQAWVPAICAPAILAVSIPSHINLGVRHILAIYPMLAVVAGLGAARLFQGKRVAVAVGVALLAWQALSSALAHPNYLAYFNEFVGSEPERVLADSDLDWGQDLQRLSDKLRQLGVKQVSLIYFGTADLSHHGLPTVKVPEPYQPVTGWVAVSASMMTIASAMVQKGQGRADHPLGWLKPEQLVANIGKSIKLYYVPERR